MRYNKIMSIAFSAFKFIHYTICAGLVLVILLQTAKSGDMAGIFSGGGSDQIFNAPSRMAFIKKVTILMACIFLFTSLMLTKLSPAISVVN
ncbi:protein translocase subunit SecG [Candidatus Endomicrobiellum trichonymphae]|nr:protein translocase subunit SecG [Candidatus Endomicrobium trichonymphae]